MVSEHQVTTEIELIVVRSMDTQKSLCLSGGLEFPHSPLPHPGRLMGLLDSVVGILVINMNGFRDQFPAGNTIAAQFIGHNLPRLTMTGLQ